MPNSEYAFFLVSFRVGNEREPRVVHITFVAATRVLHSACVVATLDERRMWEACSNPVELTNAVAEALYELVLGLVTLGDLFPAQMAEA